MSKKAPKPRADWEAIEREYRAGSHSVREVARIHGVSEKTVRNRAKELGWTRDLTEQVQAATKSALSRTKSAPESACGTAPKMTDEQIVEEKVAQAVHVVFGHRTLIGRMNRIVNLLIDQLEEAALSRDELEKTIAEQTAGDDNDKRYNQLMKAVALPTHTTAIVNLTNAGKTVIGLERQAFNIGDEPPQQQDALTALIDRVQTSGSRLPIRNPNQKSAEKE